MRKFIMFLFCVTLAQDITSENILVVFQLPPRSHFKSFQPLFEELIERGHNLTIINSGHDLSENYKGKYTSIDLKHLSSKLRINFAEMRMQNRLQNLMFSSNRIIEYNDWVLKDSKIQQLLSSNSTFDAVLIELFHLDVSVAFGHYFNAPVIGLSPQRMLSMYSWITGNPITPSYCPNLFLPFSNEMSLVQRLLNSAYGAITNMHYEFISLVKSQKQMNQYFFKGRNDIDIPRIKKLMQNISLILENSHYSIGYPEPHLPNHIQIAGLHITKPTPLPENINKFMNEAPHGVIYVSLGSLIDPKDIKEIGETLLDVLSKLPQKVILKWDSKLLPYISENLMVLEWIPQSSVLMHPNCRLFITHGGFHSLLEAVKYSVPLIGIPFFTDQQHNIAMIKHLKIGSGINLDFTRSDLLNAVQDVLANPKYRENIKKRSQLFNDRLVSPMNAAIYWIEYVMRYHNPNHWKPASIDLEWYQYLLIDVVLLFIVSLIIIAFVIYVFLITITRFIFSIGNLIANMFNIFNGKSRPTKINKILKTN